MCHDCVRFLPEAPSTLCITWDTVCVCVCLTLPAPPTPHCVLQMFIAHSFNQWGGHAYMCQDCIRFLPEAPSTLCITRDTVCVCVFAIACSPHPPLRPPDVHSPLISLVGGHADMCQDCIRSLPEVPSTLCIKGDTVCVCVFDIACSPTPHCVLPMFIAH